MYNACVHTDDVDCISQYTLVVYFYMLALFYLWYTYEWPS